MENEIKVIDYLIENGGCDLCGKCEYYVEPNKNETLRNAKVIYETVDYCAEDLRKAEKRIAELEKELINDRVFCKDGICYPMNCQGALKQFAERLIEKMPCEEVFKGIWDKIHETLKEFVDDNRGSKKLIL